MATWKPGNRAAARALEVPYPDVPGHLVGPLWAWVEGWLLRDEDADLYYKILTDLRLHGWPDPRTGNSQRYSALERLKAEANEDPTLLLDMVESTLELLGNRYQAADEVESLLGSANSAYTVRPDNRGLADRVDPAAVANVQGAIALAGANSAGEHLTEAWNCVYGRRKDPVKAYSEAIKAVEAAAAPVISPKNLSATLGTLIGDIKGNPAQWGFAIQDGTAASMDRVLGVLQMLWQGQVSRHAGVNPTPVQSMESAQAAVHLAVTLCQWFLSGAVK